MFASKAQKVKAIEAALSKTGFKVWVDSKSAWISRPADRFFEKDEAFDLIRRVLGISNKAVILADEGRIYRVEFKL